MNTKKDRIELLKGLKSGEIKPDQINKDTLVVSENKEAFVGYMANVASKKAGSKPRVVFVGSAKKLMDQTAENLKTKRP